MIQETKPVWKFENKKHGNTFTVEQFVAHWEVSLDPISDDYTPDEISAYDLFYEWVEQIKKEKKEYQNGLIPIHWSIDIRDMRPFAAMPFQYDFYNNGRGKDMLDFLTIFSWPINITTNEPLNWFKIPVIDKSWRVDKADTGGFIQEATGWKPSILQPYIHLLALEKACKHR